MFVPFTNGWHHADSSSMGSFRALTITWRADSLNRSNTPLIIAARATSARSNFPQNRAPKARTEALAPPRGIRRELPPPSVADRRPAFRAYINHWIPTRREPNMSASAPAVNVVALVGNLTAGPVTQQIDGDQPPRTAGPGPGSSRRSVLCHGCNDTSDNQGEAGAERPLHQARSQAGALGAELAGSLLSWRLMHWSAPSAN
jgi:hypothetical protein